MTDVLSQVLKTTQTGVPLLCESELLPPWGLAVNAQTKAAVHVLKNGPCWFQIEGMGEPECLKPNDILLVARGQPHRLIDSPSSVALPYQETLAIMKERLEHGSSGPSTLLLCAAYEFAQTGPHPILDALPLVIHIKGVQLVHHPQLRLVVELLMQEADRHAPGKDLVVPRMVDCLLILIIRAWLKDTLQEDIVWQAALSHAGIARVLVKLHEKPESPWTVEDLAQIACMSRASFSKLFSTLIGKPPLAYVTQARMNLAVRLLRTTTDKVEAIALRSGYESIPAFGRAFRRHFGTSPGCYRRDFKIST